ncbi:13634_t:CDS:2, partial [Funneliformis geosporum]
DFDSTFLLRRRVKKDEVISESDDGKSDDNGDFETFKDYASLDYEPF